MYKYSFIFSIKIIKMKNKILKLIVVLVIAFMAVFNWGLVSKSSDLSDVSLANVEALAEETSTSVNTNWCYPTVTSSSTGNYHYKCNNTSTSIGSCGSLIQGIASGSKDRCLP
jgi:hypothetical protein